MKILLAEDHALLGKSLKLGMEEHGWTVDLAVDGSEALYLTRACSYDVLVLDWLLPKVSGLDVLRDLRAAGNHVPAVLITAKGAISERVEGLNTGADDYVVKPFDLEELFARINAVYRRSFGVGSPLWQIGGVTLNIVTQQAWTAGTQLDLTGKEYDLLSALAGRVGQLVRRDVLSGILYELDAGPESNSLDVLLARLRKKLAGGGIEIATVRGKGFLLRVVEATP